MKNNNTKPSIVTCGMWQLPYKAVNVLCPDGKRRTCKLASQPELWATSSSTPYLNATIYHPLPVSLQGGEDYHVYRLVRRAKGIIQEGDLFSGELSHILSLLPSPDSDPRVYALMNDLSDKVNELRNAETRGRVNSWTYYAG